jgi:predicted RNA-binding protein associated with RNAse of E/G family
MTEKTEVSQVSSQKLHLRYIRLPNHVLELYDDLVYKSKGIIVGKARIASAHSVVFDGEVVLASGFEIVYFDFIGKWFSVGKIRNMQGKHTGYYCDIVTPPRLLEDGGIEITDLFLDLWVSPDLRYEVLDEAELEDALCNDWVAKQLYEKAKEELNKLIQIVKRGKFPPYQVKYLEKKLRL